MKYVLLINIYSFRKLLHLIKDNGYRKVTKGSRQVGDWFRTCGMRLNVEKYNVMHFEKSEGKLLHD